MARTSSKNQFDHQYGLLDFFSLPSSVLHSHLTKVGRNQSPKTQLAFKHTTNFKRNFYYHINISGKQLYIPPLEPTTYIFQISTFSKSLIVSSRREFFNLCPNIFKWQSIHHIQLSHNHLSM